MDLENEEDDVDDEALWDSMCVTAARWCSVSTERAKAIADEAGLHAYGHLGIVDLVEVVAHHVHNREALERLYRGMRAD
jgi:hypothetical protein